MLPKTLASALQQDYPNTEIILYDDGSTDETPSLAASYGEQVKYVRNPNAGIAFARTKACLEASGELIAFLDDDDLMPPNRLSVLYDAMRRNPEAKYAVGELAVIDQSDRIVQSPLVQNHLETILPDGFEAVLWPRAPITVHTALFRKSDGEEIGWFNAEFSDAGEDKDFFARLGKNAPIVYTPEVVSLYRRGHASLTQSNKFNVLRAQLRLFGNALADPTLSQDFCTRMHYRIYITLQQMIHHQSHQDFDRCFRCYYGLLSMKSKLRLRVFWLKQIVKRVLRIKARA